MTAEKAALGTDRPGRALNLTDLTASVHRRQLRGLVPPFATGYATAPALKKAKHHSAPLNQPRILANNAN
jgi:hypothetical protein